MDSTPSLLQRIHEMLVENQYWPQEQMLAYHRSQLGQLLRHAKATVPFYKTRLESFLCYGQNISDEQRQKVRDSFGARSIGVYSSKEAGLMACQCTRGTHFHINEELVFVEILNERNAACMPSETGCVAVTPFHSTTQPMIRYERGDLATFGEGFGCSSMLKVLRSIEGRQDPVFRFPDRLGREVLIDKSMPQKLLRAAASQMAQTSDLKFEIRYVADTDVTSGAKTSINKHLRQVLNPELRFQYKRVAEIPRNSGGKQQRFVREIAW